MPAKKKSKPAKPTLAGVVKKFRTPAKVVFAYTHEDGESTSLLCEVDGRYYWFQANSDGEGFESLEEAFENWSDLAEVARNEGACVLTVQYGEEGPGGGGIDPSVWEFAERYFVTMDPELSYNPGPFATLEEAVRSEDLLEQADVILESETLSTEEMLELLKTSWSGGGAACVNGEEYLWDEKTQALIAVDDLPDDDQESEKGDENKAETEAKQDPGS